MTGGTGVERRGRGKENGHFGANALWARSPSQHVGSQLRGGVADRPLRERRVRSEADIGVHAGTGSSSCARTIQSGEVRGGAQR